MNLQPIATCPKDGSHFIAWGPSGYTGTPLRCEVCRFDADYRPKNPIVNHAGDAFTDGGEPAMYWSPLPYDAKAMLNEIKIATLKAEIEDRARQIEELGGIRP